MSTRWLHRGVLRFLLAAGLLAVGLILVFVLRLFLRRQLRIISNVAKATAEYDELIRAGLFGVLVAAVSSSERIDEAAR